MADTLEGEAKSSSSSGGSGEWRLAVTTEAAPTVTLSGLKQVHICAAHDGGGALVKSGWGKAGARETQVDA